MVNMEGSKKVKRVTWATDLNLCQVRMFLMEESPSEVAIGTQDHLQAKASGSHDVLPYANLPPGFEGLQHTNSWGVKLPQIPLVKWKIPTRFQVNREWSLVAGEESTEVEFQNQRELGMLEAIYPRPSAIPPNPSGLDTVEYSNNTEQTPVIPLTPIEEEDTLEVNPGFNSAGNAQTGQGESDVMATLTSIMAGKDQGNLIDRELLIKILSDPKMVEQLLANHLRSSSDSQSIPSTTQILQPSSSFPSFTSNSSNIPASGVPGTQAMRLQNVSSLYTHTMRPTSMSPLTSVTTHMIRPDVISPAGMANGPSFYPPAQIPNLRYPPAEVISSTSPSMVAPVAKDINYYKSLIQQHGGERREPGPQFITQEQMNMGKPRDVKQKIMKPCMFFNTPKGCRSGADCNFLHELAPQLRVGTSQEVPSAKRLKLDRKITGL